MGEKEDEVNDANQAKTKPSRKQTMTFLSPDQEKVAKQDQQKNEVQQQQQQQVRKKGGPVSSDVMRYIDDDEETDKNSATMEVEVGVPPPPVLQTGQPNVHASVVSQPGAYMDTPNGLERVDNVTHSIGANDVAVDQERPEAPYTNNDDEGLVEARQVQLSPNLPEAQQVDSMEVQQHKNKKWWNQPAFFVMLGVVLLCAIVLGTVFGTQKKEDSPPVETEPPATVLPSPAPSSKMDLFLSNLLPSTLDNLQNSSTPQFQAWQWLANQNVSHLPEWRLTQRFALATFFYAFQGPHWPKDIRDNWMDPEKDECFWFSSEFGRFDAGSYGPFLAYGSDPCSEDGDFNALTLADLDLFNTSQTPFLPPEIGLLTSMHILAVPKNWAKAPFEDFLPTEIAQLTALVILNLGDNRLFGTIPSHIMGLDALPNLKRLALDSNLLSSSIPSEIGLLSHLERLYLNAQKLNGTIPSEMGLMKDLTNLELVGNNITGTIPIEMTHMSSMERMFINVNELSGTIPTQFGTMTSLIGLALDVNKLTGTIPTELGNPALSNLLWFSVNTCKVSGTLPTELANLETLGYLFIRENWLSGTLPTELGLMTTLIDFNADNNLFSGSLPSQIGLLNKTVKMSLFDNQLSGFFPSEMALMASMVHMRLHNNDFVGSLPTELGEMEKLRWLHLANNTLTGSLPSQLGKMLDLQQLLLGANNLSGTIPSKIGNFSLIELDLSNMPLLSGTFPPEIVASTGLSYVRLEGSSQLSGVIPESLCSLQNTSCTYNRGRRNCTLEFDCTNTLCGCDCTCSNVTATARGTSFRHG